MKTSKEYIVAAAINIDGMIICGKRHSVCFQRWYHSRPVDNKALGVTQDMQGFYTSLHRRVDRYDAMDIALEAGQVKGESYKSGQPLFSEDLR